MELLIAENEELKDFSIITFNHKVHGKSVGTIGIIGPKRMDYSKVISVLKYINRRMNNGGLLGDGKKEDDLTRDKIEKIKKNSFRFSNRQIHINFK